MSFELLSKVDLSLGPKSYSILIGDGLMRDLALFTKIIKNRQVVVVSNEVVAPLYSEEIISICKKNHIDPLLIVLPDGERHKSFSVLMTIFDKMLEKKISRDAILFALGGGVIGDIAGFASSCYLRGIDFVQIPTTLLAQVDSSVGGKTAVNHVLGKNMIGAFYQPKQVIIDINTLQTLSEKQLASGIAEIIKYGCIFDSDFFDWIEKNICHLLKRSTREIAEAIKRSCEIKAEFVSLDEKEIGQRALLNFGHTFGHALERGLGYGKWLHGEAVGCGMVMAAKLSMDLGFIDQNDKNRIKNLVKTAGLPVMWPDWPPEKYFSLMSNDKKVKNSTVRYVILKSIGEAEIMAVDEVIVKKSLFEF